MIDTIYAHYSRLKKSPLDPNYKPEKAILNRDKINTHNSQKLAVIFPGWHNHNFPVNKLAKRLAKKGWDVIVYNFHDQILEPDEEVVVESFRFIQNEIVSELDSLLTDKKYKELHLIGISLGNVPMALVADRFSNFQGVTIVAGGDDLAIDMWYGLRTKDYQLAFQKMNVGVRRLDNDWYDLAPANHVHNFSHKPVLF